MFLYLFFIQKKVKIARFSLLSCFLLTNTVCQQYKFKEINDLFLVLNNLIVYHSDLLLDLIVPLILICKKRLSPIQNKDVDG